MDTHAAGIGHVELILLGLLVLVAALAVLAKHLAVPYPIILVIGGLFLSLIPRAPRIILNPDVVFLIILPPLLFSAAFHISWREFRRNIISILMLAFGLVGFTVFGVALGAKWLLPGFDWKLGLVLGAVVATTDPISATATGRRLGLPRQITDLLEAESLVNDGSGLVALKFTVALVVTGITPSVAQGTGQLIYLILTGVAIGLLVGSCIGWVQKNISEAPIEITISLITPYIAYLAAESAHCSGVMATLACGLFLGRRSSGFYSLHARIESTAFWKTLDFILNGIVFLLLGLQLPTILSNIEGSSPLSLTIQATLFCLLVIILRLLWVYPGAWFMRLLGRYTRFGRKQPLSRRAIFIVGWSGMRGVLALAAAISLPERLNSGAVFPGRNLIIFLTFCLIFVTLVLQGLSLPPLIRRLGLSGAGAPREEEQMARREMITAALEALEKMRDEGNEDLAASYDQMEHFYRERLALLDEQEEATAAQPTRRQRRRHDDVASELRKVERSVALRLRDQNKINDEVLRDLERELDLLEARFVASGH